MSSISKEEALIFLPAYQNQGTLVDYLDPWIAVWTSDFILSGLSDSLHQKIMEAGFTEDELEDVVQVQPDIKKGQFGFEKELLKEWTDWIMCSDQRKETIKKELTSYFFWKGKPFWEDDPEEMERWQTEEGMPETPQEALEWYKEIFGENKKE